MTGFTKGALLVPQRAVAELQGTLSGGRGRARTTKSAFERAGGRARGRDVDRPQRPEAGRPRGLRRNLESARRAALVNPQPDTAGPAGAGSHVEIFHQPPDRRHGDRHPHGGRRGRLDARAAGGAVPEHRAAGNPGDRHLSRRRRADARAVRRHAARRADQRRRQHELHVLGQRQQRADADHRGFRRQDRPEYRPGAHAVADLAGAAAVARAGEHVRADRAKVACRRR